MKLTENDSTYLVRLAAWPLCAHHACDQLGQTLPAAFAAEIDRDLDIDSNPARHSPVDSIRKLRCKLFELCPQSDGFVRGGRGDIRRYAVLLRYTVTQDERD